MTYQCFDLSIQDNIAHIKLNRPEKRNSMSPEFWQELPEIVRDIDQNARARVIVISSTGPHFSSGLDVSSFTSVNQTTEDTDKKTRQLQSGTAFYQNVLFMQESFNAIEEIGRASCRERVSSEV